MAYDSYGPSWFQAASNAYLPGWYKKPGTATPGLAGTGKVLTGAAPRDYNPAFGGIPQVTDPNQVVANTIAGNAANLGGATDLANAANKAKTDAANAARVALLPDYNNLLGAASSNVLDNLEGQLSPDVINALKQSAAERGIATGLAGGPNTGAAYLRALGLTSMDLQKLGQTQYGNLINTLPNVNLTDPNSYLLTPDAALQQQNYADYFNSAPAPGAANYAGVDALKKGVGAGKAATGGYSGFPAYAGTTAGAGPSGSTAGGGSTTPAGNGTGQLTDSNGNTWTIGADGKITKSGPAMTPDASYQDDPWGLGAGGSPDAGYDTTTQGADWWNYNDPFGDAYANQ